MKILYLLFKIGPYHHTRFKYIAKQYDLTVVEVFPTSREYDWNDIDTEGIYKVVRLNNEEENELKGRKLLENINKLICAISPDVVVTMGWSIKTYFAALKVAKSYNIPVCCLSDSTKDDYRRYWIIENLKSSFVKSFDSFLVAGKRSKQYLNNLGIKEGIFTPMDVVDNDFFANPRGIVKEDLPSPYLLCVSRMIEEKNLFSLIESFANFKKKNQSNLKLMIIGSGPLENKIKEFIYSLNISDIVIKEFIQNNLLPDLYANAKALILPSIKDTWGLVVNEAMASGIPVIVSDRCGCCDDLVINEVNGWVIKPTIDGIYNALIMLSGSSEGKLKEMGNMSRKIISKFSLNDFNIGFVSMIDYAINNNKKLNFIQKLLISLRIYF